MEQLTDNKTIAKNTLFLYFRMMFTMLISLYTSRIILQVLGVNDFGLYAVVGSVLGMMSFLNNALSTGSSRFLTFELGTGNFEKLRKTFSTVLSVHILLAILIVILAETIGLWFLHHKVAIPPDRFNAALWVYHLSVFASVLSITQVPYSASIISHEKMNIYAYSSIIDVSAKLGIVYVLQIGNMDKLILYAILLAVISIGMQLYYRFYCISNFKECHYQFTLNKTILKSVGKLSGWNLFANTAIALNTQGTIIITNMFFGPAVVTARTIAAQVNMAANQFVQNFRTASNPQIVKKYAAKDYENSKQLLLNSTRFSFYLMFLLGLPIILLAKPLLQMWLGIVPEYSVVFLQLVIVQSLFSVFDTSFYTALYAKGQIRENALISPLVLFIQFPTIYLLFKSGFSPLVLSYAGVISYFLLGIIIKPILVCKIVDYTWKDIVSVFLPCLKVCLIASPIPILITHYLNTNFIDFFVICLVSTVCVLTTVFYFGLNSSMRIQIVTFVKNKIARK